MNDVRANHHDERVDLSLGTILTITDQNTNPGIAPNGARWACAAVWTGSRSPIVLATIIKSDCSPPPIVSCTPAQVADKDGVIITLWFHDPEPGQFLVDVCLVHSDATGYLNLRAWGPHQ